ncbi:probable sugar phosphate/phosphate translocator At1g06470 isoform X2 [Malania oleifera]|uniref:probable sugar phosphate/phosphate translocator At1g06470 isoform X2 n=1 Tax=Malania oleifera TaxID=397392 RepID=UPI0025ADB9A6|nr:probable sugar phosphate/phosphate translocator At1g06470 isoform X2 [Malania oleifera]
MVESDFEAQADKVEFTGSSTTAHSGSGLRREPSFSRWCVEDGIVCSDRVSENADASVDDSDFELPLLQQGVLKFGSLDMERYEDGECKMRGVHVNGGNRVDMNEDGVSNRVEGSGSEKYVPFDIEDGPEREVKLSGVDDGGGSNSFPDRVDSPTNCRSPLCVASVLKTLFFILVWYNKTLLGDDMGKFPAPLLMNTVHFSMQAVLSKAITWFWSQRFQPGVTMSWRDYFFRVVPTALGTALDVNLSNASLVFISVTFATMCKSASPIFLLLFAFAFRLESPSIKLLGIILIISVGILLTVAKETEFDFWGFIFVMLAAVMSGFRWSMTQILLQREAYGLKNPLVLMSYVTPVMAIATAFLSLMLDPWRELKMNEYFNNSWHVARSCLLMFFGGTLAFFMVLTEFILVSVTSAVTVTIAGVVKEAVTILVAVLYFHDKFTWLKGVGLFTIMIGVSLFNWYKYEKLQKAHVSEDDMGGSVAKYVILEEMDDREDSS